MNEKQLFDAVIDGWCPWLTHETSCVLWDMMLEDGFQPRAFDSVKINPISNQYLRIDEIPGFTVISRADGSIRNVANGRSVYVLDMPVLYATDQNGDLQIETQRILLRQFQETSEWAFGHLDAPQHAYLAEFPLPEGWSRWVPQNQEVELPPLDLDSWLPHL